MHGQTLVDMLLSFQAVFSEAEAKLPSTSLRTAALWPAPPAWLVSAASPMVISLIDLQQALHRAK